MCICGVCGGVCVCGGGGGGGGVCVPGMSLYYPNMNCQSLTKI